MNPPDGCPDEMDDVARMSDEGLDRLLASGALAGGPARGPGRQEDVDGLQGFFQDLRSRYRQDPSPAVEKAHLALIVNAARLHTDQMRPALEPSGDAGQSGRPQWRRKIVLSSLFGSLTAKLIAAGAIAATAATGGLAVAGDLPSPVQQAVAGAAGDVGVNLPNPAAGQAAAAAQKVVSTVDTLAQQVTAAAAKSASFSTAAVQSARDCTHNVTTIATQLAGAAAGATTPALAQSLAGRATALAQEAIGCASPAATGPGIIVPKLPDLVHANDPGIEAITGAVQDCADQLKPPIETLVQTALNAGDPAQIQTLVTQAKAVADAALGCAQGVGKALNDVVTTLPVSPKVVVPLPAVPTPAIPTPINVPLSGVLKLIPGATRVIPNPPAADNARAPKPMPNLKGPWWTGFLSSIPSSVPVPADFGVSGTASAGGGGTWAGLTGSWTPSGAWEPYQLDKGSLPGFPRGSHGKP